LANRHFWTNWVIGELYKRHGVLRNEDIGRIEIQEIVDLVCAAIDEEKINEDAK